MGPRGRSLGCGRALEFKDRFAEGLPEQKAAVEAGNQRPTSENHRTLWLWGCFQPRFAVLQWGTALGEGTSGFQGLGIAWFIFLGSDRSFDKSLYVA